MDNTNNSKSSMIREHKRKRPIDSSETNQGEDMANIYDINNNNFDDASYNCAINNLLEGTEKFRSKEHKEELKGPCSRLIENEYSSTSLVEQLLQVHVLDKINYNASINAVRKRDKCFICESTIMGAFKLQCNRCKLEYHPNCLRITEKVFYSIEVFYCYFCIVKNSNLKLVYKSASALLYCICRTSNEDRFMIGCDNCDEWFHGDCIKISEMRASVIEKFYCKKCKNKDPGLEIVYKEGNFVSGAISFEYVKEEQSINQAINKTISKTRRYRMTYDNKKLR